MIATSLRAKTGINTIFPSSKKYKLKQNNNVTQPDRGVQQVKCNG
jgi:hypothetical protein